MSQTTEPRLYPLTPVQEGMLLRHLQSPASGTDVQQLVATVNSGIDATAFCAAWQDVCMAHPVLRTRFHWKDLPEPRQEFSADLPPEVNAVDLGAFTHAEQQSQINAYLKADRARGFRLDAESPCRVTLFLQRDNQCAWVWSFPHLILDGGSFATVIGDVDTAYAARCDGRAPHFAERPQYSAFLDWLTPELERRRGVSRAYFLEQLRGFTARNAILQRDQRAETPPHADRNLIEVVGRLTPTTTAALRALAHAHGVTMSTLVNAAWALVVGDSAGGDDDVVFGVVRRGRAATIPEADRVVGMFINTVPLRIASDAAQPILRWLAEIQQRQVALRSFEHASLAEIQGCAAVPAGEVVFDSIVVFNSASFTAQLPPDSRSADRSFEWIEQTGYPVTLFAYDGAALELKLCVDPAHVDRHVADGMIDRVTAAMESFARQPDAAIGELQRTPVAESAQYMQWNATNAPVPALLVHEHIEAQARTRPEAVALVHRDDSITYAALNARANGVAAALQQRGVRADVLVGVCMDRGIDMMVALLAILKAGGAYVPIDPGYPSSRIAMMVEDCAPLLILTQESLAQSLPRSRATILTLDGGTLSALVSEANVTNDATPSNLAYMIFTSGSTGRPKGVLVEHRNVANFFVGMDERIGTTPGVWLAVTSISFDISVLELFWTLGRGFTVVLQDDASANAMQRRAVRGTAQSLEFSLFYFAADAGTSTTNRYRLLLDGARYADTHDFTAVWTPERHFHAFGGLYPNPAVTSAAVAAITSNVQLRAGSVVLPLHDPIRIAEEWSVVDNLSNGRVGLSFASGWHANDFALAPENYATRKAVMFEGMNTIRKLWRGESVAVPNGKGETIAVQTLPRPVQREPQFWVSAAGSTDTFETSGTIGANMLTNMLGQSMADLESRIGVYRAARRAAGHDGRGHVTLMLHTFIGDDIDTVKRIVREPFMHYLRTSTDLVKQARWEFPAFARPGQHAPATDQHALDTLSAEDEAALMSAAFERYFQTHGLFGTPESCAAMIQRLKDIGVDEVACLIDFGVDEDTVLASLDGLNRLRELSNPPADADSDFPISAQVKAHAVTHLQCTPTLAHSLLQDHETASSLTDLQLLLLGGEALPESLAQRVHQLVPSCRLMNMYGPTETTVWSTSAQLRPGDAVTIGTPLANTEVWLMNRHGDVTPPGVPGELCISGEGVVRGYHDRPDHTDERFVTRRIDAQGAAKRLYRTGDIARWNGDGTLTFLGRADQQLKIRGHRIELGEIEHAMLAHPDVSQAVTIIRHDTSGQPKLVAYVTPQASGAHEADTERADYWRDIWAEAYADESATVEDVAFNVAGWASSTTGERLTHDEMREWVDHTVSRIRELQPTRILSIGCGTGLLLFRLAHEVERYTGVDYAAPALENIRRGLAERSLDHVELVESPAHDLSAIPDDGYDVVVINSVIQYFPTEAYLQIVLRQALAKLAPGGALFIGDVRSLPLLDAFHTAVALARTAPTAQLTTLASAVDRRMARESELVVDPQFFEDFASASDDVEGISIELKHTKRANEMTAFRYDVVLRKASPAQRGLRPTPLGVPVIDGQALQTVSQVRDAVAAAPDGCRVVGLRNARVTREVRLAGLLQHRDRASAQTVADAQALVTADAGLDPADIYSLDGRYDVRLKPTPGTPERFDAVFVPRAEGWHQRPVVRQAAHQQAGRGRALIREPLVESEAPDLVSVLRTRLSATLPAYMVPDEIIVLDVLPRTPNGKIDRNALRVDQGAVAAPAPRPAAAAPNNDLERKILAVWRDILGHDRFGVNENFFDLGANSLLMMQANSKLRSALGIPVSLVDMFANATIESLAKHLHRVSQQTALTAANTAGSDRAQARRAAMMQRSGGRTPTVS